MAMVVVLSVFNGIQQLVNNIYSAFDADLHISAERGTVFAVDTLPQDFISKLEQWGTPSYYLEEDVLLRYRDNQTVATLRGVDDFFVQYSKIDTAIYDGVAHFGTSEYPTLLLGGLLRQQLQVPVGESQFAPLNINAPVKGKSLRSQVTNAQFLKSQAMVAGAFSINLDFDNKYVIASLPFTAEALGYNPNTYTGIELILHDKKKIKSARKNIEENLPPNLVVKTKAEKNELLFAANQAEKWVTFLILAFIMFIGGFNIIASLQMLIIEKQRDLKVLKAMGLTLNNIRQIFFMQGLLINSLGSILGILLGLLICWLQITFGLVKLQGGIVAYYPVIVQPLDLLLVIFTVLIVSLSSSWIPVKKIRI